MAWARQILTATEELQLTHTEGAAIGAARKLRFGTNALPWEFDKKNQIFTAPHFNVNKNLRN